MKSFVAALLALVSFSAFAATEGKEYRVSNPSGKTEVPTVVEVFSYACPHCYGVEPGVAAWVKNKKPANAKFVRVHATGMNPMWDLYSKVYYTAEVLGILEKTHDATFKRHHVERKPLANENDAAEFLAAFGPKKDVVLSTMKSFPVVTKMSQAKALNGKHGLRGVPGFLVNDKYFTDFTMNGSEDATFGMLETLLKK